MTTSYSLGVPFPSTTALSVNSPDEPPSYIPGHRNEDLDQSTIDKFLAQELNTPILDELYPRLWSVARKSSANIDPLHKQRVKGRAIVPTEDPQLHLIWYHDRIHLKPIPDCLLNHNFWTAHLPSSADKASQSDGETPTPKFERSIALGFLRSYAYLVQHRSDFKLAREHQLIPDYVDWVKWSKFIYHFRHIKDAQVAKRYHYGQMRLSRLNWAVRLFQPRSARTAWFYEIPYWSTGLYVQRAIAPLIFAFASISLVLSSMQVALAVPTDELGLGLQATGKVFWAFSIMVMFWFGLVLILLFLIPFCVLVWQLSWGYKNRGEATVKPVVVV